MKSLSIKAKIAIVSAIAVGIIGYVAIDNYFTLKKLAGLAANTETAGLLLRQHLDGDMMHDAIRADVLKATLGLKTRNEAMIRQAQSDAAEHGARASQDTSAGSTQVLTAADELARNSVRLKRDVSDFLAEVRSLQGAA